MSDPEPVPGVPPVHGRAAHVIGQLYYYVVAVIGVGLVLGGLIGFLFGVRTLALPREFEQARDGLRTMLHGLAFALPGAAVLWWHLREARRREGTVGAGAFWGRSLYFHLVALVSLVFVIVGAVMVLSAGADAAVPHCFDQPQRFPIEPGVEEGDLPHGATTFGPEECYPGLEEAGRQALDGLIFVVAAGPVWVWHLRQGRRPTSLPESGPVPPEEQPPG